VARLGIRFAVASRRTFMPWAWTNKTIQAILRHSNIGITQNIYIKSVSEISGERDGFHSAKSSKLATTLQRNQTGRIQ